MAKTNERFTMTDRERALMAIISELWSGSIPHWFDSAEKRKISSMSSLDAGFDPMKKPEKGDLVLCSTNCDHFAGVAVYVEPMEGYEKALLKSLGSDDHIEMMNEKFIPIVGVGLNRPEFYYGYQRVMYDKVLKAFARGDEWGYRYRGLEFDGDSIKIKIGAHIFLGEKEPFDVTMKWNKKTTIKQILEAMISSGYGSAYEREGN